MHPMATHKFDFGALRHTNPLLGFRDSTSVSRESTPWADYGQIAAPDRATSLDIVDYIDESNAGDLSELFDSQIFRDDLDLGGICHDDASVVDQNSRDASSGELCVAPSILHEPLGDQPLPSAINYSGGGDFDVGHLNGFASTVTFHMNMNKYGHPLFPYMSSTPSLPESSSLSGPSLSSSQPLETATQALVLPTAEPIQSYGVGLTIMVPADAAPAAQEPTPGDVQPGPETRPRKRRRSVDEPTNDGESMAKKKKKVDGFNCGSCGKYCGSVANVTRHIESSCPNGRRRKVQCPYCPMLLSRRDALKRHCESKSRLGRAPLHYPIPPFRAGPSSSEPAATGDAETNQQHSDLAVNDTEPAASGSGIPTPT